MRRRRLQSEEVGASCGFGQVLGLIFSSFTRWGTAALRAAAKWGESCELRPCSSELEGELLLVWVPPNQERICVKPQLGAAAGQM